MRVFSVGPIFGNQQQAGSFITAYQATRPGYKSVQLETVIETHPETKPPQTPKAFDQWLESFPKTLTHWQREIQGTELEGFSSLIEGAKTEVRERKLGKVMTAIADRLKAGWFTLEEIGPDGDIAQWAQVFSKHLKLKTVEWSQPWLADRLILLQQAKPKAAGYSGSPEELPLVDVEAMAQTLQQTFLPSSAFAHNLLESFKILPQAFLKDFNLWQWHFNISPLTSTSTMASNNASTREIELFEAYWDGQTKQAKPLASFLSRFVPHEMGHVLDFQLIPMRHKINRLRQAVSLAEIQAILKEPLAETIPSQREDFQLIHTQEVQRAPKKMKFYEALTPQQRRWFRGTSNLSQGPDLKLARQEVFADCVAYFTLKQHARRFPEAMSYFQLLEKYFPKTLQWVEQELKTVYGEGVLG